MTRRPTASKNLGDDYRDAIGLSYVVQMLKSPATVLWVAFESDEAGSLDDVTVGLHDRVRYIQAKYTVEESVWSLDDLLAKKAGSRATSLLQKWVLGWKKVRALGSAYEAVVKTRRRPDPGLAHLMSGEHVTERLWTGSAHVLEWQRIRDHLADADVTEDETRAALAELQFEFGELDVEQVFAEAQREFLALGGTPDGWNSLVEQFRRWVRYTSSTSDGRVRVGDARVAAQLWQPDAHAIPQEFQRDPHFIPLPGARERLVAALDRQPPFVVLEGSPGSGKSSLLSWLAQEPPPGTTQVLLHHCFVGSEDDFRTQRLSVEASVEGLLEQIYRTARDVLVEPENPDPQRLAAWLGDLARDAHARHGHVLVILDGVDHMVREHQLTDARRLLSLLPSPLPAGLKVVIGTQPIQDLLPPSAEQGVQRLDMATFDEEAVAAYLEGYAGTPPGQEVVRAAFARSEGNPLYLRYLVESSADVGYALTMDRIEASPPFDGDIARYYAALWGRLHPGPASDHAAHAAAQLLVSLLGWADFSLPAADLDHFALTTGTPPHALAGALRGVRHLLAPAPLAQGRLRLYHDSLRRFVREQDDAAPLRGAALRGLLAWLTGRADAETRWSAEWELRLHLGEPEPLLEGTTRSWVIESFTRHRPHQRTLELLRLAGGVAADRRDLRGLLRVGWLRSYVSNAIEVGSERVFIDDLHARLNLGMNEADVVRAVQTNRYPLPGLARLGRTAARLGYATLLDAIVEAALDIGEPEPDVLTSNEPDPDALLTILTHDPETDWDAVVTWYQKNRSAASPTTQPMGYSQTYWRRAFEACVHELARLGRADILGKLLSAPGLDAHDRRTLQEASLRGLIRDGQLSAVAAQLAVFPSVSGYAAAVASCVGSTVPVPTSPLLSVPPAQGAGYLDDGGWRERHAELVWSALAWSAAGRGDLLAAERRRLERDGLHGQVLAILVDVGADVYGAVQARRPLDVAGLSRRLASLSGWTDATDHHFSAARVALDGWLPLLTLALELVRAAGIPVELSAADLWAAHEAVGTERLTRWLERDGLDFTTAEAAEPLLDDLEAFHTGAVEDFQERAATLARLANAAATFGAAGHAERLLRTSAGSLLAHGNRKDVVLFDVLKSLAAAHHPDGEGALRRLAPFVEAITDLTDGSETRHLPMRLFEALLEVSPGRARAYLNAWIDRGDDWRSELGAADLLKGLEPGDPVAYALAVTLTSDDGFRAARAHLGARADHLGTVQVRDDYERWLAVDCPPALRGEESRAREREPRHHAFGPPLPVEVIKSVLRSADRRVMDRDGEVAFALRGWRAHTGSLGQVELVEVGRLMLARDIFWEDAGPYDDLCALAWGAGERELAFRAVVAAQTAASGWASYHSSRQESDDRVTFVVQHFRQRFEEFAVASALRYVQAYGATQVPPRLIAGLWQAGKRDLARAIARDFLDFAETLKADVALPTPDWLTTTEVPDLTDTVLRRLGHLHPSVRVRTAVAVAELYWDRPEVLGRLATVVGRRPAVRWEAALLALSLLAHSTPGDVAALLPALGPLAAASGPGSALLFNEVCRICGRQDLAVHSHISLPPVVESVPEWFVTFVRETTFLASDIRNLDGPGGQEQVYEVARASGLTEPLAQDARRAEQHHVNRSQWSRTPICTAAFDLTASALLDVAGKASGSPATPHEHARLAPLLHVDGSLGRLRPQGRPAWLPAVPMDEQRGIVTWVGAAETAFTGRLVWPSPHERLSLFSHVQLVQGDGQVAARMEARAFAYLTVGTLPDAEDVWRALGENWVENTRFHAHLLDDQQDWQGQVGGGRLGGLRLLPLTARLQLTGARWHFLPQLTRVAVPVMDTLGPLTPQPEAPLTYDAPDLVGAVRGRFWQDGAPTQLFTNRAAMANVGYELDADLRLVDRLAEEGRWSVGWAVRLISSARQGRLQEPEVAERMFLHGVSSVVRPS